MSVTLLDSATAGWKYLGRGTITPAEQRRIDADNKFMDEFVKKAHCQKTRR